MEGRLLRLTQLLFHQAHQAKVKHLATGKQLRLRTVYTALLTCQHKLYRIPAALIQVVRAKCPFSQCMTVIVGLQGK